MTSKEIGQTTPKPDNSLAIKAISASALVLFSTFMMVRWQRMLSQVETATETAATTAVTEAAAPPVEESKRVASEPAAAPEPAVAETVRESAATETEVAEPAVAETVRESAATETEVAERVDTELEASEIAPVEDVASAEIGAAPKISEPEIVAELNQKLYDKIDQSWRQYPSFEQNLAYRVNVEASGAIASYEPITQAAVDYLSETPMQTLSDAASASSYEEAIASFLVVLTPAGRLEVSPWLGQ